MSWWQRRSPAGKVAIVGAAGAVLLVGGSAARHVWRNRARYDAPDWNVPRFQTEATLAGVGRGILDRYSGPGLLDTPESGLIAIAQLRRLGYGIRTRPLSVEYNGDDLRAALAAFRREHGYTVSDPELTGLDLRKIDTAARGGLAR